MDELVAGRAALTACRQVAAALVPDDASKPTACPDLDVQGVVVHLLGSLNTLGGAGGAAPNPTDGASPEALIAAAGSAALDAWTDKGLDAEGEFPGGGTIPGRTAVGIIAIELLVHAWDLADATGHAVDASPELADCVLGLAGTIIRPEARDGQQFGTEVTVGPDANALDRLVAFTGRQP